MSPDYESDWGDGTDRVVPSNGEPVNQLAHTQFHMFPRFFVWQKHRHQNRAHLQTIHSPKADQNIQDYAYDHPKADCEVEDGKWDIIFDEGSGGIQCWWLCYTPRGINSTGNGSEHSEGGDAHRGKEEPHGYCGHASLFIHNTCQK